jgi:hypothetical protein
MATSGRLTGTSDEKNCLTMKLLTYFRPNFRPGELHSPDLLTGHDGFELNPSDHRSIKCVNVVRRTNEYPTYFVETTIIEKVLHYEQIHLCRFGFTRSPVLIGLFECNLVTTEDFGK